MIAALPGLCDGQDISGWSIRSDNDIFVRETFENLAELPAVVLPLLDCAVEYVRRFEGREITYRRGPISLHQTHPMAYSGTPRSTDEPRLPDSLLRVTYFMGGILVDLPRAGEASGHLSSANELRRYMLRVSVAPLSYENSALRARTLIERAVVEASGDEITVLQSEVFARTVEIRGNDPLHFALPAWEPLKTAAPDAVPASLEEALLITLEAPRYFGFSRNIPEPFASGTRLVYAVPSPAEVTLSVLVNGKERTLDEGRREPGTYHSQWMPLDAPDGVYTARLLARDDAGVVIFDGTLDVTKDGKAASPTPRRRTLAAADPPRIAVSTESGLAFQFPVDSRKSLRHMFTHAAVRVGYRFSPLFEAGLLGGQDSFHERPAPNVDIERISDYGGVVAYTYGYIGPYLRLRFGGGAVQPFAQAAALFTNKATVVEAGFGAAMQVFRTVQLHLIPTVMSHLKSEVSTKVGLQYGIGVNF